MIDILETLVNFRPVTKDQQAVGELLTYVEGHLVARGLHVERQTHNGVESLYASTQGTSHAKVMLQGHIDVVPNGEKFGVNGDRITGRGCYDMLFATASFLRLIDELDDPARYDLSLLLTGDEEVGGFNGVGTIMKAPDYTCDVCVLPDAGEGLGTMSIGAKGVMQLILRADGAAHHASRPWEGDGAAGKLVTFLDNFTKVFDTSSKTNSTMTISKLEAGSEALNQGPAAARTGVDIRYTDKDDLTRIKNELTKLKKEFDVSVEYEQIASDFNLDMTHPLVQKFTTIYETSINAPVRTIRAHGSSDARFFDEKGIPVIMFRPDGGGAHADNEWLSKASWKKFHGILERYVQETAIR